jgi:hypothetical protein
MRWIAYRARQEWLRSSARKSRRLSQVKTDSEKAIDHLQRNAGGYVFWHDYASDRPNWVEVGAYLEREIAPLYELLAFRDTGLALIRIEPIRQERARLRSKITALGRDLAAADDRVVALDRELTAANDAIHRLQAQCALLQGELQRADERWNRMLERLVHKRMPSLRSSGEVAESSSHPSPESPVNDPGLKPSSFRIWMRLRRIKARTGHSVTSSDETSH